MKNKSHLIASIAMCILAALLFAACGSGCSGGSGGSSSSSSGGGAGGGGGGGSGGSGAVSAGCPVGMPAKGQSITDSDFGTTIARITDKAVDGYTDAGIENEYARMDPENSDGTLVILRGNDGEWYLYNATTFAMVRHLTGIVGGGQEPEPRWDPVNPKVFYYLYGMELRSYNVDTDASTMIRKFTEFPGGETITTQTEGDASVDRRYWCFEVKDASSTDIAVFTYDKTGNAILGQKTSFPDSINWVSMDMSGKHCLIGYDGRVAQVLPPNLSGGQDLPDLANGHMDLALTADGKDVMVYQNNHTDFIAMADLNNPSVDIPLLQIPFNVNTDIEIHISGNAAQTPGWAVVSTASSVNPPTDCSPACTHSPIDNKIFMLQLVANPPAPRFIAHNYSFTSLDYTGEKNYFAESFASINTKGTKIYFGSNWCNFTANYTDAYVVNVPAQ